MWVPLPAPESVTCGALFVFFNEWVRLVGGGRGERGLGKKNDGERSGAEARWGPLVSGPCRTFCTAGVVLEPFFFY